MMLLSAASISPQLFFLLFLLATALSPFSVSLAQSWAADDDDDVAALLKFKSSISGGDLSTWSSNTNAKPPCTDDTSNWARVRCHGGLVWSIQLRDMGLTGRPDIDSLSTIQSLRTLSLVNNSFHGPLPSINKLTALKSAFLSYNKFSGNIPDDAFNGMLSLKKLHLHHNAFTGNIPSSLAVLPKLLEVRLQENHFSGQIPIFLQTLQLLDVSNNALEGPIPPSLSNMNSTYFSGNKGLCGPPLANICLPVSGSSTATQYNNKSSISTTEAAIVAGVVVVGVMLAVVIIVLCQRKRDRRSTAIDAAPNLLHKKTSFSELQNPTTIRHASPKHKSNYGKKGEAATAMMKLTFVKEDTPKFDLQDLLKASAEILGSGCFGASYKAALITGEREENVMVVKRFKQMNNVGREEFQEHMRRLGKLSHPNLLPLVAYYYRKEEKLLVSEYVSRGSLALHLHSNTGALDWPIRLKVVKGVARGLIYLYNSLPTLIAPHGHLKSSNVLLNASYDPLLHDYGLTPVINQEISQHLMVAYKSPEYHQHTRITKKTDVWSFGILILEIITGRLPSNFLQPSASSNQDQDLDLAAWVQSVGPSNQVFDKEMKLPGTHYDSDIIHLLNIALACCEPNVDKRLDIKEAADKIEEIKEPDDDFFSLCGASDADFRSTRALSDDFSAPR